MENVKKIVLRAGQHLSKEETLNLRGTKALKITQYQMTEKNIPETLEELEKHISRDKQEVTTWSAIVRNALDMLKEAIGYTAHSTSSAITFQDAFDYSLEQICNEMNFKLNSNCPKRLYKEAEEDDLINSKVYKSNKNHLLKVITDEFGVTWYMCAVYTQEIIVMLEALLDAIYSVASEFTVYKDKMDEFPQTIFVIEYMERENQTEEDEEVITETVADIDTEIQKLSMTKDLYTLQMKVGKLSTSLLEIYADIQAIVEKYDLPTLDEVLGNK